MYKKIEGKDYQFQRSCYLYLLFFILDNHFSDGQYCSILDKVLATCSRVEQRLNDKRKINERRPSKLAANPSEIGIKILFLRLFVAE